MSLAISSTVLSPPLWRNYPRPPRKIALHAPLSLPTIRPLRNFGTRFELSRANVSFCVKADPGGGDEVADKDVDELRGKSTMPDRFKYLTQEPPSPPLRWPWVFALAFLVYAWRSVLWELSNWHKVLMGMGQFIGYQLKFILAIIFHFIGDPITYTVYYIETVLNGILSLYSSIVTSALVPELTTIVLLASTVLAIGRATSPNSVNCQPYTLTVAGIIGYAAVRGFIIEPFFWLLLFGIFSFSRFFKKRDYVSSVLPVATVLASVGEPWIRLLAIISFTSLAICHHSAKLADGRNEVEVATSSSEGFLPFPLLGVALAIGIRVTSKWAGYRHLTWMIV